MALQYRTVPIPLVGGLDTKVDPKSPQARLVTLENGVFVRAGAVRTREGTERFDPHTDIPPSQSFVGEDECDIIGRGLYDASQVPSRRYSFDAARWAGAIGVATRDDELVLHNGTQLVSRGGNSWNARPDRCYLPRVDLKLTSNYPSSQTEVTHATTGVIDVYAWMDSITGATYAVYDASTGALITGATALVGAPITKQIQLVPLGGFVQIYGYDDTANAVWLWTVNENSPWTISSATAIASSAAPGFDVTKIDEDTALFAYVNEGTGQMHCHYMQPDGGFHTAPAAANTAFAGASGLEVGATNTKIGIAVHPQTRDVCAIWRLAGGGLRSRVVRPDLTTTMGAVQSLSGFTAVQKMSVCATYLLESDGTPTFQAWASSYTDGFARCYNVFPTVTSTRYTRFSMHVVSRAFRIGDEAFCFLDTGFTNSADSLLQHGFYLFSGNQGCHGVLNRGEGRKSSSDSNWNTNIWSARGTQDQAENPVCHFSLGYNRRLERNFLGFKSNVYADPGFRSFKLDFRATLRAAQVGRSLYLQGMGLREYDGESVYEAGFLMFPEGVVVSAPQAGGSLTSSATYQYRVYWGRYNARGEFTISAAITVQSLATTVGNQQFTLTIPCLPATTFGQSKDIVALVYRTIGNGSTFFLESSLDPTSPNYVKNNLGAATVTFVSGSITDAALSTSAVDPANQMVIDNTAPIAGATLTLGNGRLWQTGGEVGPNAAIYTKTFVTGDTPGWNEGLIYELPGEVKTVALAGGQTLVLGTKAVWSVDGDGPSNQGLGDFPQPRALPVDLGASQVPTAMIPGGVVLATERGLRALTGSGSQLMGEPEKEFLADPFVTAMVAQPEKQRVLIFRSGSRALVWDYLHNSWSVFTGHAAVGACLWRGRLVMAQVDGSCLVETPDAYSDQGVIIPLAIETGNLRGQSMAGKVRCRRVGFVGAGQHPYRIRTSVSFDEGPFRRLREWDSSEAANTSTWGSSTYWGGEDTGEQVWGSDSKADKNSFRFRRPTPRRKCSTVAVRFETTVSAVATEIAPSWIELSEIQLELGEAPGLATLAAHRS